MDGNIFCAWRNNTSKEVPIKEIDAGADGCNCQDEEEYEHLNSHRFSISTFGE